MILPPWPIHDARRHLARMALIHQITFVATMAIPTYVAAARVSDKRGIVLAWYHHAGLAVAGVLVGVVLLYAGVVTLGLVAMLVARIVGACRWLARR